MRRALPIAVTGRVVPGDRRGRELGFPTANVRPHADSELPPFGVYVGWVRRHAAAISVGVRPTFGDGLEPLVEAHLLDFDGDLYGEDITIQLTHRLRDELRFETSEALRRQMDADVVAVREALASGAEPDPPVR